MYRVRDLYPNMPGIRTGEKTLMDADEVSMLHGVPARQQGSIWIALGVLVGTVVLIGVVQR